MVFSVLVLLLKYNFCLRNNYNVFYRSFHHVKNLLIPLRILSESGKIKLLFRTVLTLLLLLQWSPCSHIYCIQIVPFHCVCLSHSAYLIWFKFVKIPKKKFESQLTVVRQPVHLLMRHVVSANQSVRYIET